MHEYYRKNKGKLQKEMDGYLKLVRSEIEEVFGKSYPQAFAEIWSCYEREMLEHFPFIGGDGSSGTRNLTGCMFFVAVGVVGKKYGLSTHDWGRLATTLYERHFDQMPRLLRRLAGGLFHHCPGLVTIVPLHVELPGIVDVVQSPRTARLQRGIGVFHLSELDP